VTDRHQDKLTQALIYLGSTLLSPIIFKVFELKRLFFKMPDEPPYRVLDEIIKSPLDANEYKLLQLCPNGLKVLLISTSCESPANLGAGDLNKETCAYQEVEQFNLKYLNIPPGSKGNESSPPLEKDEDMDTDSRSYRASRALKKKTSSSRCGPRNSKQTDPEDNLVTVNVMIGSGDFHDPKEFQGMAHFVEHCVFLGSEKYPEAEYIETFTDMHDGETNANTNSECTNFMIKIGPSVLEEALDVLIDCISNPILDENALMSEVETMNNEIAKHRLEEDRRYHYMLQSILANPAHPMSNLGGGSRRTLNKTNLVQETRSWKNKNYIAQNMILGIKGGLPMSRLIEIAVKYGARLPCSHCSDLPRMKLVRDFENVIPFPKEKWNHIYYLTPFVEEKWVRLSWVLPAAAGQDHKTKPIQFLKYLFHSKVPGSLDHFLRRNGWLLKIEIWTSDSYYLASRFCTIFQVNLNLTAKGMKKKNDIIKEVFSYIKTIHKSQKGIMERVFNEMKQNNADSFHYTSDSTVSDPLVSYDIKHEYFLTELGMTIFNTSSAKEILISTSLTTTFDENLIQDSLAHLSDPSNINIMIGESKESLTINNAGLDDGEDNPLGINYTTCQLNPDFVRSLQRVVAAHDKYHLPSVNEFISKRNICYPPDPNEKLEHENDLIIEDSERAFIIYSNRECKKGLLPTAEYVVRLESPRADNWAHPTVASILPPIDLWIKCIEYILESKYMFATVSNSLIGYSVEHKNACIEIVLYGPARKLSELMILIVNAIVHFEDEITKEIFDNMVQVQRVAYTQDMMSAETYANDLRLLVLEQKHCLIADKLEFLNGI
jgi:secreted Zn-dependent insulinase-like peptidase